MDRLEAMSILLLTVEKGSFTAAAKSLNMPLPTVSRKVTELEAHLGTKLLIRTTRKLVLTDSGVAYVAAARRILGEIDDAERVASGEFETPRGELVLTAPVLFGRLHILPIVTKFLATYPDIDVRLIQSDRNLRLVDDHVDLAVRIGALPDSGLVATRVGMMATAVCASPSFLARHGMPARPQDLAGMPCVSFDLLAGGSTWSFSGANGAVAVPISPRLSVTTAEAAVLAARRGTGVTRVFRYQCTEALQQGALREILREFQPEPLPVSLLHASRGALPLKARVFLDFASGRLKRNLLAVS